MPTPRRLCAVCGKRRDVRFFVADNRRTDGLATRCVTCAKRARYTGSRGQRLMDTYGITTEEYDLLLEKQVGRCAICCGKRPYNLDVDHDHQMEQLGIPMRQTVRGLLCKTCNRRLLKAAKDDVETLKAAIDYLTRPPAWKLLGTNRAERE